MAEFLNALEGIIRDRKADSKPDSYTNQLFNAGIPRIAQKVGEEGVEVAVAALAQSRAEQIGEFSDLFYHALVLMAALDIRLSDVETELERRHQR